MCHSNEKKKQDVQLENEICQKQVSHYDIV